MSEDIFDHPDLDDPAWGRTLKQETRRSFWQRNRLTFAAGAVVVVVAAAAVAYNVFREEQPEATAGKVDFARPFDGTRAAGWADGDAGLAVSAGGVIREFTAEQVMAAMLEARQAIVVARLDDRVTRDDDVEVLASFFAPDARKMVREQPELRTRIKPGYRLLDVKPKVNGLLTVDGGRDGELVIHARFMVAYAFHTDEPDKVDSAMDIVAIHDSEQEFRFRSGPRWAPNSWGLWPGAHTWGFSSFSCAAMRDGLLAPAFSEPRPTVGGGPVDLKPSFPPTAEGRTTCPS